MEKYLQLKELGSGSFGDAILLRRKRDNRLLVGKRLRTAVHKIEDAMQEAALLKRLRHTNIVGYVESFVENTVLWIIMDYADGGDLHSLIMRRKKQNSNFWSETEIIRIFIQLCLALKFIHDKKVLHRDLKAQNVFLTQRGVVKLGDFGIARVLDGSIDVAHTQIGTPYYLSPEICRDEAYGKESDIWSLGCVLYEMLALEVPFQGKTFPAIARRIMTVDPDPIPSHYSTAMQQLVSHLLTKSPNGRPSINRILRRPFIQDHIRQLISATPCSPASPSHSLSPCNSPASVANDTAILEIGDGVESPAARAGKLHESFVRAGESVTIRRVAMSNAMMKGSSQTVTKSEDDARRIFLENQAARQRNKQRVELQERQPACFLDHDEDIPMMPRVAMKAEIDDSDMIRKQYVENRQAAQRIKAKVYQQLGRYMPGDEPSISPLSDEYHETELPQPPPVLTINADSYADIARQNYLENRRAAELIKQKVDVQLGRREEVFEKVAITPPLPPAAPIDDIADESVKFSQHNNLARELRHKRYQYAAQAKGQQEVNVEHTSQLTSTPPPRPVAVAELSYEEKLAIERKRVYEDRKSLWKRVQANKESGDEILQEP